MNTLSPLVLESATEEAIYNLYMYLIHKKHPMPQETFQSIINKLEIDSEKYKDRWNSRETYRLNILKNNIDNNPSLALSEISDITLSKSGLTACCFIKPDGNVSVIFKGTGSGEWLDNGKGLSGIPEENTYIHYGKRIRKRVVHRDYATDQQVQALNWFNRIAKKNNWDKDTSVIVSGHSKGGNKAQFITVHSDLVTACYSFDGQGFSPEALESLKKRYGNKYERRRQNIMSFSAGNDYVNVLGKRLTPEENIYYFESLAGLHFMEAILNREGQLRPQCEQGRLSLYVQGISERVMSLSPGIRQYATLGIMDVFQKYLGKEPPLNESSATEKTVEVIASSLDPFLSNFIEKR